MKKFLLLGLVAVFVAGFAIVSYAGIDNTFEVAIVTVDGKVQVDEQGNGTWITAVPGMRLKTGAGIKTDRASMAEIVYDAEGLNIVNIDEKTRVIVKKGSINLEDGSVLVNFYNLASGSEFVVKTPTAACGIRGSGMGVDFINDMTVVRAFEDSVYVRGLDANGNEVGIEVIIPEGWKSAVESGQAPEPPEELSVNELKVWDAWVRVITGETTEEETEDQDEEDEEDEELDNKDLEEGKTISPSS
ncbi:MAG: FecR domain-containing protein [Candidatus Omnitrophica bacterium]|nr:FecR domain-containing protein [Candidatus Omnitrophota bacterium]